jgi:acyl transferase domain-containing protein/SAM-dependent methyltransferase
MKKNINDIFKNVQDNHLSVYEAFDKIQEQLAKDRTGGILYSRPFEYGQPHLRDHRGENPFDKRPDSQILLGVTHCCLAVEAAAAKFPEESHIHIHRLLFQSPVVFYPGETAEVCVVGTEARDREIPFKNGYRKTSGQPLRFVAGGELRAGSLPLPTPLNIADIQSRCRRSLKQEDIYGGDESRRGESLMAAVELAGGDNEFLANLSLPPQSSSPNYRYQVHPALLDGAFVCAMTGLQWQGNLRRGDNGVWVPFMMKEVFRFAPLPHQCLCWGKGVLDNNELKAVDLYFCDEQGNVCLEIREFTFKFARLGGEDVVTQVPASEPPVLSTVNHSSPIRGMEAFLTDRIRALLGGGSLDITPDKNFMQLGVDSNSLITLAADIERELGVELYPTLFFEYQNIAELTGYFASEHKQALENYFKDTVTEAAPAARLPVKTPAPETIVTVQQRDNRDIAVIGMAGRFAQSETVEEFWGNLLKGEDLLREIPADHWDVAPWFSNDRDEADKTYCKWGSFIDVDRFDPLFFGVTPREAMWMDPQLRILLEVVYETMEDAGYAAKIAGSAAGVFVGVCLQEYWDEIVRARVPLEDFQGSSSLMSALPGRISYTFDLQGPSIPVDNACASSLTAIHLAVQALRNGECPMAFAAGSNVLLSPLHYVQSSRAQALSPTGKCNTFDKSADGYVPGEGVAALLLKSLDKAEADGDHIHAVIKGSAVNHVGKSNNPTSPRPELQEKVIRQAWTNAGVDSGSIGYIEAHGTGTILGDPIEMTALKKAFGHGERKQPCYMGSTKAHLGHLEGAAGIAGVIKAILTLKHRRIPAMPNFNELNPYISLDGSPFAINKEPVDWTADTDLPRRAGVSSFGLSGTNVHVVLEEYAPQPKTDTATQSPTECLFVLSAKNLRRLQAYAEIFAGFLLNNAGTIRLADLAFTLQTGREAMEERLAIVSGDIHDLISRLRQFSQSGTATDHLHYGNTVIGDDRQEVARPTNAGDLRQLAGKWVNGAAVDWDTLYPDGKPRILSLPTYPFERKRYWGDFTAPEKDGSTQSSEIPLPAEPTVNAQAPEWEEFRRPAIDIQLKRAPLFQGETAEGSVSQNTPTVVKDKLKKILSEVLMMEPRDINEGKPFLDIGLDSILAIELVKKINTEFAADIKADTLYSYPTVKQLAAFLAPADGGAQAPFQRQLTPLVLKQRSAKTKEAAIPAVAPTPVIQEATKKPSASQPIGEKIREILAAVLFIEEKRISDKKPFMDLGLDSILAVDLVKQINLQLDLQLKTNDLYSYPTVEQLTGHIEGLAPQTVAEETPGAPVSTEGIAIVGMSGRFPGASNVEEFWSNLENGVCSITGAPSGRWRMADEADTAVYPGGYLDDADAFDSLFFNISGAEAEIMDPQQRLFLEEAWRAVEDAGYSDRAMDNLRCGVYAGVATNDYINLLQERCGELTPQHVSATAFSILASRIAYHLNLKGASFAVDAACASALAALHMAVKNLEAGALDMALVGGVNVLNTPLGHMALSSAGMLSPTGQCRVYDHQADGFVLGEAVGVVVVKRLPDALNDGDHIYGVVIGSGMNQNGRSNGLQAPNAVAQAQLAKEILEESGIEPASVSYIEPHGTGSKLGDSIEVAALTEAYGQGIHRGHCGLGAVKANVGHTLAAAGIVSLIKVLQALGHERIPPVLHYQAPNSDIDLDNSPFRIDTRPTAWTRLNGAPLRAAVTSFGINGTNAQVIVQEPPKPAATDQMELPGYFIPISAATEEALERKIDGLLDWLQRRGGDVPMGDVAFTLLNGRSFLPVRTALVAESIEDLTAQLEAVDIRRRLANGTAANLEERPQDIDPTEQSAGEALLEKLVAGRIASSGKQRQAMGTMARLFVNGHELDFDRLYAGKGFGRLSMPTYPFEKVKHTLNGNGFRLSQPAEARVENAVAVPSPELKRSLKEHTVEFLKELFSRFAKIDPSRIKPAARLGQYGIDSLMIVNLNKRLEEYFGQLPKTLFFEYQTLAQLSDYFVAHHAPKLASLFEKPASPEPATEVGDEGIAVIGVAGRYPQAKNVQRFWENLKQGKSCFTEVPALRWDSAAYFHPDPEQAGEGKIYARYGAFLDEVDTFDPLFFQISPREAESMDPQERLFLETTWALFEDAGYTTEDFDRVDRQVGCFVGVMNCNYEFISGEAAANGVVNDAHLAFWSIPNRVSYFFDFQGPSMALDTACSSSLTAVHLACESIRRCECRMAVAGGVHLVLHPVHYQRLCRLNFLSPSDKCKAFGAGADGFLDGEGVGAVLLKPEARALEDGDRIYAVIKGSFVNAGGRTNGFTVPNPNAQANLIATALDKAGIDPATISYVEAHGTGTSLGDPIEIAALSRIYSQKGVAPQSCSIGSVKTNIGHLESAAGIAGLTKLLLQFKHRTLVPSLHSEQLNPYIDFEHSPFYVQHEVKEWTATPLRAAISSFGGGGANAHLVLEESGGPIKKQLPEETATRFVVVLSARTEERLRVYAGQTAEFLDGPGNDLDLADIAFTLQTGRTAMTHRWAAVVESVQQLREWLRSFAAKGDLGDGSVMFKGKVQEGGAEIRADLDLLEVARLWTLGAKIDWRTFYAEGTPSIVSLPTYPFARERYWIPAVETKTAPEAALQRDAAVESHTIAYYEPVWRECPAQPAASESLLGKVLVVAHDRSFRNGLRDNHSNASHGAEDVVLAMPGEAFRKEDDGEFFIDTRCAADFQKLLSTLDANDFQPDTVAVLLEPDFHSMFFLLQAFESSTGGWPRRFVIMHASPNPARPHEAAVAAFSRSLRVVKPEVAMTFIGYQSTGEDAAERSPLDMFLLELSLPAEPEVLYRGDTRFIKAFAPLEIKRKDNGHPRFRDNGVYLITGGCGGIGRVFAQFLARQFRARIVLTGRSPLDEEKQEFISQLTADGAKVLYVAVDAADEPALREALKQASQEFGPFNGIIHSAGVQTENRLFDKDFQEAEAVLRPKVEGTEILDRLTADDDLDFFILFSSMSAVLGDFGQCDYAAANRFMDEFAALREEWRKKNQRSGVTRSINWPLWREGGMHFDPEGETLYLSSSGMSYLESDDGIDAFEDILCASGPQVLVLSGIQSKIRRFLGIDAPAKTVVPPVEKAFERKPASGAAGDLKKKIIKDAGTIAAQLIKMDPAKMEDTESFGNYGFDSVVLKEFSVHLSKAYGVDVPPTIFFQRSHLRSLSDYLLEEFPNEMNRFYCPQEVEAPPIKEDAGWSSGEVLWGSEGFEFLSAPDVALPAERRAVAIIGVSGFFPGCGDIAEFWENLKEGKDMVSEIPPQRWDWRETENLPGDGGSRRPVPRWAGMIDNVDRFDPAFFNFSPREADRMDPQQRLLIQSVWQTFEDSGYNIRELAGQTVGVFVGNEASDYHNMLKEAGDCSAIMVTGTHGAALANRISFLFDFRGPSEAVNTGCSSSMVAVHRAFRAVQGGECRMAVAGGANLILSPKNMIITNNMGILSPDGRCRTFDRDANGYVKGEGVAVILLKSLAEAKRDGDHIYASIIGSAVNHGGKANSFTAPNADAQADLVAAAIAHAGISADTISYIEAHGTGTELGDPVEINGLKQAFAGVKGHSCGVGTVKTNIGHLEAASGIAGVVKVLLSLRHKFLPGLLHFNHLNPLIDFSGSPFYIVDKGGDWQPPLDDSGHDIPRRAGVSSFGFGGTNGHVILEEYKDGAEPAPQTDSDPHIIVLSARNREGLEEYSKRLLAFLNPQKTNGIESGHESSPSRRELSDKLRRLAAQQLGIAPQEIDIHDDLTDLGFDPLLSAAFVERLNSELGVDVPAQAVSSATTLCGLADCLARQFPQAFPQCPPTEEETESGDAPPAALGHLAFTLQVGREAMEERLAFVATSIDDVTKKLVLFAGGEDVRGDVFAGNTKQNSSLAGDLFQGRGGERHIEILIQDRDLVQLARLWVLGVGIDWRLLHQEAAPCRISLPTYPFQRKRCWYSGLDKGDTALDSAASSSHPFIDRLDLSRSLGEGITYKKTVRQSDVAVAHHRIAGQAIFPGVGYLEMFAAAAGRILGDTGLTLRRAAFLKPLAVGESGGQLSLDITIDAGNLRFVVSSEEGGDTSLHAKGEASLGKGGNSSSIPLDDIRRRCTRHLDADTVYSRYEALGLRYGPLFRGVTAIDANDDEALGDIAVPQSVAGDFQRYILHPTIMDGALQVISGLVAMKTGMGYTAPLLPFAVEEVEILAPPAKRVFAYVTHSAEPGGHVYNVLITDEQGRVCLRLNEVSLREAPDMTVDSLAGLFYTPHWSSHPLPDRSPEAAAHDTNSLLLDATDSGAWDQVLSECPDIGEIVFLALSGEELEDPGDLERLEIAVQAGVIGLFRLVKMLAAKGLARTPLRMMVVTSSACAVLPGERVNPYFAALHGLVGSISKEFPHWEAGVVDIDAVGMKTGLDVNMARNAFCYAAESSGYVVALRHNRMYIRYLLPLSLPEPEEVPLRREGVYVILGGAGGIGRVISCHLAEKFSARVVMLGRSPLSGPKQEALSRIEELGGEALYIQVNGASHNDMLAMVNTVKQRYGAVHGVIHSAIVLEDHMLETMSEQEFLAALAPKVTASAVLYKVFKDEDLDFMMFFSSMQSFSCNAGQSNYAAGCAFKDSFALAIGRTLDYPVKIVNWGYWGEVGVVASEFYKQRLEAMGVRSITPAEGAASFERVLSSPLEQVVPVKGDVELLRKAGMRDDRRVLCYPPASPLDFDEVVGSVAVPALDKSAATQIMEGFREMNAFGRQLLLSSLRNMGVMKRGGESYSVEELRNSLGIIPLYHKLFDALLDMLAQAGWISTADGAVFTNKSLAKSGAKQTAEQLRRKKETLVKQYPPFAAHLELLWTCLDSFAGIVTGAVPATDVMFPDSRMDLVEAVYKGNLCADYFNRLTALAVRAYVQRRLQAKEEGESLTVIEVGAGTGGTTEFVLEELSQFKERIRYIYTDVSVGFLKYGRQRFGGVWPNMEFKPLDIQKSPGPQGFAGAAADVVVASNVLHATGDMAATIGNVKQLLTNGGWLVLNELTGLHEFATLTFGLLEGWWLVRDLHNRLLHSPLLDVDLWKRLLAQEGFRQSGALGALGKAGDITRQHVLIAESDGIVVIENEAPAPVKVERPVETTAVRSSVPNGVVRDKDRLIESMVIATLTEVLEMCPEDLDLDGSFTDFGVDSIMAVEVINVLNTKLEIGLRTTDLFNYPSIKELAQHIEAEFGESLKIETGPPDPAEDPRDLDLMDLLRKLEDGEMEVNDVSAILGVGQ